MRKRLFVLTAVLCVLVIAAMLIVGCGQKKSSRPASTLEVPQLDSGPISGLLVDGVWTYLGIPYAAPPVGDLRWKEPQPVAAWQEVRTCNAYGPACPQPDSDFAGMMKVSQTSEDCLYLNVWTPAASPDEKLPVMVWIHGGAFTTGSGSLEIYDGHNLAEKGVVIVTINYRLGPFGFLAHPLLSKESPHGVSGNYGLLDQIASLQWVQENIAAFGGNPDLVTIFGESAGGMSINDLMVSPLADGLFDRAIVESGPMTDMGLPIDRDNSLKQAEQSGTEIATALGCDQAADVLACLRGKTAQELLDAPKPQNKFFSPIALGPNVDGWVLPDNPSKLFAAGKQHHVPLLTGTNANEGSIFAPDIPLLLYQTMLNLAYGNYAGQVSALFPADTQEQVKPALSRLITEMGFAASARFTAESMAEVNSPAYMYQFTRVPKDPRAEGLGSFHGLEIVYVFGNSDKTQVSGTEQTDKTLSQAMMDYWTNFAKTGDPNGQGLPDWPACLSETDKYQELGDTVTTKAGLDNQSYELVLQMNNW